MEQKFFIEADIKVQEETKELRKSVAAVIDLPDSKEKQPDLLYFTALFVSSGTNLNGAHFLPSELVKAEHTIISKALDVEHKEEEIIGHIYERAFINKEGIKLDLVELANREEANLNKEDVHVLIAGVVYKSRFPNLAEEISNNDWKVSMECYFQNYDVKIGDMIITRKEAETMGLANDDSLFGKMGKVVKKGKDIAKGKIERVLRDICFSGCGIVKNPANPPSVILETANEKIQKEEPKNIIVLDYDKLDEDENKLTSNLAEEEIDVITDTNQEEVSAMQYDDTTGICVNYKRRVYAGEPQGPNTEIIHEDWCSLYDQACTSFGRDTSDPECLRNQLGRVVKAYAEKLIQDQAASDRRIDLTKKLEEKLEVALSKFN